MFIITFGWQQVCCKRIMLFSQNSKVQSCVVICMPALVLQVREGAAAAGVLLGGENALPCFVPGGVDQYALDRIVYNTKPWSPPLQVSHTHLTIRLHICQRRPCMSRASMLVLAACRSIHMYNAGQAAAC